MGFAIADQRWKTGIREAAWKRGGGLALADRQTNPQTLSEPLIVQLLHDVLWHESQKICFGAFFRQPGSDRGGGAY